MLDLIGAAKVAKDLLEFFAALTNKREIAKYMSACCLAALSVDALANNCIVIHQQDRNFVQAIHQGRDTAGKDSFANWLLKERLSGDIGSGLVFGYIGSAAGPRRSRTSPHHELSLSCTPTESSTGLPSARAPRVPDPQRPQPVHLLQRLGRSTSF